MKYERSFLTAFTNRRQTSRPFSLYAVRRVTNLVKNSATPGPAPSRSSSSASMHQGQTPDQNHNDSVYGAPPAGSGGPTAAAAAARPGGQPFAAPRPGQQAAAVASPTGSPFHQKQPPPSMPRQGADPLLPPRQGESRGSSLALPPPLMGSTPPRHPAGGAGWPPASSAQGQQPQLQNPFGQSSVPRPPGVTADKQSSLARAGVAAPGDWSQRGSVHNQPRSIVQEDAAQNVTQGAGGAFGGGSPPRSAAGSPMLGKSSAASVDPTRSPTAKKNGPENGPPTGAASTTPGAGAAVVAKRLLNRGMGDAAVSTPGKSVPHVSSAPILGGRAEEPSEARDSTEKDGSGGDVAGGEGERKDTAAGRSPKSEPRKVAKGKGDNLKRRASAGGAGVAAKPGRLAKMMSKWLYPEAKVSTVLCAHNDCFRTSKCSRSRRGETVMTLFGSACALRPRAKTTGFRLCHVVYLIRTWTDLNPTDRVP